MQSFLTRVLGRARRNPASVIVAGALLVATAIAVPVAVSGQQRTSTIATPAAHHAPKPIVMGSYPATKFAAAATKLPSGLATALERDVHLSPAQYLANSAAALEGVKVVAGLKSAGVQVLGSKMEGTRLVVNVASSSDVPAVEAVGATAVIGAPATKDYSNADFQAVSSTNTYGGEPYFFQQAGQTGGNGYRCSIGFNGYAVSNGAPEFTTAGHCETAISGSAYFLNAAAPISSDGSAALGSLLGTPVTGLYGSGSDYGIVATTGSSYAPQDSVATWGGGGTTAPVGGTTSAPDATAPTPITGESSGIVGATLCKSGSTTGWTCGSITDVDTVVLVSGQTVNAIIATTCLLPGDSGGAALIGTAAVGIDSGGSFGTDCSTSGADSVFFPMVSAAGPYSVSGQQGSNWQLGVAVSSTATVTAPVSAATVYPTTVMTGTITGATAGSTALLYLDGSTTPFAKADASSGSWSIPLTNVPLGSHTYQVAAGLGWSPGPAISDSFTMDPTPPTASHIDSITGGVGSVAVAGWAVWPDKLSSSVSLAVQVGANWTGMTANQATTDSGLPAGAGVNHGFAATVSLAPGTYSVCVWANNSAGTAATSIGCQSVTVLAAPPTASHIDSITGGVGSVAVAVAGWAVWPDKLSSSVNIAVNIGAAWTPFTANLATTDSGLPAGAGAMHGFSGSLSEGAGSYKVCIWAGTSTGGATNIGCSNVTVTAAG